MAKNSYKTMAQAVADRAQLERLLEALDVAPRVLRRDDCGLWVIRGGRGYASTWGDGETWHLIVGPPDGVSNELTPLAWTWAKRRLSFCEVTQDGEDEGCFRVHALPTADQAATVRDVLRFPKRRRPSEHLAAYHFKPSGGRTQG